MAAQLDFEQINEALKEKLLQFLTRAGRLETGIPGVAVSRHDFETSPEMCLCSPRVAYVAQASMAPSTFNRYFRQATGLSPLQFQKRQCPHEAERLMLVENRDVNKSATLMGYESGSQFTREYKRLFGIPPRRDIANLRNG